MIPVFQENFEKIKKPLIKLLRILTKIPVILAEYLFLSCILSIFLSFIISCFLFYKYVFLAQKVEPENIQKEVFLKEKTYKKVLEVWQREKEKFESVDFEQYIDPFKEKRIQSQLEVQTEEENEKGGNKEEE